MEKGYEKRKTLKRGWINRDLRTLRGYCLLNSTKFDTVIGTSYESRFDRMKLSILDQVPRSSETTNEIALKETADLALAAEA